MLVITTEAALRQLRTVVINTHVYHMTFFNTLVKKNKWKSVSSIKTVILSRASKNDIWLSFDCFNKMKNEVAYVREMYNEINILLNKYKLKLFI